MPYPPISILKLSYRFVLLLIALFIRLLLKIGQGSLEILSLSHRFRAG